MGKRIITFLLALLFVGAQVFAQNSVTGKVTDSKGEAIPGASIIVKGTQTGTMTNMDGSYSLNVRQGATLVFSCIGFKTQEVLPGSRSVVNVVLVEDSEMLEEVVYVAYGTAKKKDLTGSISTISEQNIVVQAQGSVTRALEGQVAGLQTSIVDGQPGLDMGIRIRGIGTANANNANALIIIDGTPALEGTNVLSSINRNDIESITVLKDAASTALYGSRGANGVVLVTTKSGKQGKTKISFEARAGINTIGANSSFKKVGDGGAAELYEFAWQSIYNDVYYGKGSNTSGLAGNAAAAAEFASQHLFDYTGNATGGFSRNGLGNKMAYSVPGMTVTPTGSGTSASGTMTGSYLVGTDGKINPNATLLYKGNGEGSVQDVLLSPRFRQEYNISASGASDKVDYHISLGMLSDPSYIEWSAFKRYTARANVNAKVTDWLTAGANFAYTHRKINSQSTRWGRNPGYVTQNVFTWVDSSTILDQMYARDKSGNFITNNDATSKYYGERMANVNYGRNYPNVSNSYSPFGYTATPWSFNLPLFYSQAEYSQTYNDMTSKGYIRANFLKHFTAEANISYDKTFETLIRFWNTESAHSMNGLADAYGSAIRRTKNDYGVMNLQQLLNYNQDMGKHHVDALLGHEYYQYDYEQIYLAGAHSLINDFQGYVNFLGTASYSTFGQGQGGGLQKLAMESYFGRANYIYDNKYYVSGSIRRDGSSKFKKVENRWGTFWSVGAGWRISAEPWMEGASDWLDNLKLRASYGVIGNQNGIDYYSGYQRWGYSGSNWTAGSATYPQTVSLSKSAWVNDSLTWENVHTTDAGLDASFFGGKLTATFDFFNKHTVNAVWGKNASILAAGQATLPQNTAGIRNRGYEFDLAYQPVHTQDWDVLLSVNGTHYNTILTDIPEGPDYTYQASPDAWSLNGTGGGSTEYLRGVGKDYFNMYIYRYGGVAGNPDLKYYGSDGTWHTGYTKGDKDAGHALFWHKVSADDVKDGTFGSVSEGDDILVANSALATRYEIGDAIPELYGGFSAFVRFKNLDLSAQFSYQLGGKFLSLDYGSNECGKYMSGFNIKEGQSMSSELIGNTWSESNQSAKFPMNFYSGDQTASGATQATSGINPTDLCVFNASYLSIKNITLGYTLPKKLANKIKMSNLRVYASADNPCLLFSHSGVDPRWSMTGGIEVGAFSYPYLSVYTFGVNIDF